MVFVFGNDIKRVARLGWKDGDVGGVGGAGDLDLD